MQQQPANNSLTDVDPVERDCLRELVPRGRDSFGLQKETEIVCTLMKIDHVLSKKKKNQK